MTGPKNKGSEKPPERPDAAAPDAVGPRPGARRPPSTSRRPKCPAKPACEVGDAAGNPPPAEPQESTLQETPLQEPPPPEPGPAEPAAPVSRPVSPISPWVIAPISGAVAAALVIGVGWILGWPGQPAAPAAPAAPAVNTAALDDLAARVAGVEAKLGKPAAPAPDAARLDALEKSLAALRGDLTALRAQSDKLAASVNELKSAPREAAAAPDLSAVNDRIAALEKTVRAQTSEIAQGSEKPADDLALRRVVAAALLDVTVRTGEPFAAALSAAKSLSPSPEMLKPLEEFAATGVPNPFNLSRELLALVPKLSPPAAENSTTGAGLVERLEAGASKLVRIERTDTVGNDRGAVVSRVTAAALRNDYNEARRDLMTLSPEDRAAAQAWLDKADARDAALAASRKFAAEAMTALAKPAQ